MGGDVHARPYGPGRRARPDGLYAFAVDGERFWLRVADGASQLRDGAPPYAPDVRVSGGLWGFLGVASGAAETGELQIEGDEDRLRALLATFRLPAAVG